MEEAFSRIASLIAEPLRSKIMWALLDGRAYTATELAHYTGTTAQNISMHLAKLVRADLLAVEKQGRHCYYNYSRPEVSYAIEALANLVPQNHLSLEQPVDDANQFCRSCYDHLAGKVGVQLTMSLLEQKLISRHGKEFKLGQKGASFFNNMGIDIQELKAQKRSFARACLDWSERKPHLAGALGAALLSKSLAESWMRRISGSRALVITGKGKQVLSERFSIEI